MLTDGQVSNDWRCGGGAPITGVESLTVFQIFPEFCGGKQMNRDIEC